MTRWLVAAVALVNLTGCCAWFHRCCPPPPPPRCWEGPSADRFALVDPDAVLSTLRGVQERRCKAYRENGNTINEVIWVEQCKREFEFSVMAEHCRPELREYCNGRCFDDRDSCSMAADTVLGTTCAERSFPAFKETLRYCADFQLKGKVIAPVPGGRPRCE